MKKPNIQLPAVIATAFIVVALTGCKAMSGQDDYVPSPGGGPRPPRDASTPGQPNPGTPGGNPTPGGPNAKMPPGPPGPSGGSR